MANSDMVWRKLPIGLIRDEDMDLIADQLPKELAAAPYMFYLTALCKADNDGIFDIEDGVIFSRLMRIGTPADVFKIANLMMKRRLILRAGETSRCLLCKWDYSSKETPRTMEQRRAIVAKKIEQERQNAIEVEFKINDENEFPATNYFPAISFNEEQHQQNAQMQAAAAAAIVQREFGTPAADFLCANDDKNAKNVVEKTDTEREKERIEIERKETHTETKDEIDTKKLALQALGDPAFRASTEELKTEKLQITKIETQEGQTSEDELQQEMNCKQGDELQQAENCGELETGVFAALVNFFTKFNLGFNSTANFPELAALCKRIQALGDNRNPPEIVAGVMLGQFKQLTEQEGYFHNAPLIPQQLLKPGTYSHVLAAASKILLADKPSEAWIKQQDKYAAEVKREQASVGNVFDDQYLQYGIDPKDPNRAFKLIQAKKESKENDPP